MEGKNSPQTNINKHGSDLVKEVKKKKEFSGLPDSVVERAIGEMADGRLQMADEFRVKEARKLLRKYFGVFLTNRVLRWKSSSSDGKAHPPMEKLTSWKSSSLHDGGLAAKKGSILDVHMSSKKREYEEFYSRIFEDFGADSFHEKSHGLRPRISHGKRDDNEINKLQVKSVIDLGCGVNGFSYEYLRDVVGDVDYVGVEAAGQLVDQINVFFKESGFNGRAVRGDLFDVDMILDILKKARKDRVVFLFQVVDALESVERNFSLKLISAVMENAEVLVVSVPLVSLGGGKKFAVKRKWLMDFLEEEFKVSKDFEMFGERILVIRKR